MCRFWLAWVVSLSAVGCGEARISLLPADGNQGEPVRPPETDRFSVDTPTDDGPPQPPGAAGAGGSLVEPLADASTADEPPVSPDRATGPANGATATSLSAPLSLLLRYDFEGEGEVVMDRVGEAHGRALGGTALDGLGGLPLDGIDDYVDMPNGLLSDREQVTIMAWLSWSGGVCWQRVFDFGSTDAGEDLSGNATSSLFLTPASCPEGVLAFMTERQSVQRVLTAPEPLPLERTVQVALAFDGAAGEVALYVDGALQALDTIDHTLDEVQDVNNWLGRSQWVQDHYLQGRYEELRIYDRALAADEVATLYERGPDAP
ncbi:MAG: LamG domain-containing protein [Myxococcales bacterium]|jgi:hypothetical protein